MSRRPERTPGRDLPPAFTMVELLVVIAVIAILAALLLPALSRSRLRAESTQCSSNLKQLGWAWTMYADENSDALVNNHGVPETLSRRQNWVNNVQDWESSDENTNLTLLTSGKLARYLSQSVGVFKCPSDREPAPNGPHIRSMSMNALVGDPGELTNRFNPSYVQFFRKSAISRPAGIFVFLDEQADTLNDGFFVNTLDEPFWGNLPGSYHGGAVSLAFADGHNETHKWGVPGTIRPVARKRISRFAADPPDDFLWLKERTSFKR